MKYFLYLLLLIISIPAAAAPELTGNQRLASLCKVWGFLKYYHPQVAKGKMDWDAALVDKVREVIKAKDKEALNATYITWLQDLGKVKRCNSCSNNIPESQAKNLDLAWIYDSTLFHPDLTRQLDFIRKNRNRGKNHYVEYPYRFFKTQASFRNEKKYAGMDYPAAEYRLLTLFRYWNMINYFFPFKYALNQNWNQVLVDMIPLFREAPDVTSYHMAMMELVGRVNDSHALFQTKYTWQVFGVYTVPFQFKIIDQKAIVTGANNDSLMQLSGLRRGDVITKIEGKSIGEVLQPRLKYIVASNYPAQLRKASGPFLPYNIFNGSTMAVTITYERDGRVQNAVIKRNLPGLLTQKKKEKSPPWRLINQEIGYADLGAMSGKDAEAMMAAFKNTKGMIIDLRKNKNHTASHSILKRMHHKRVTYARVEYPDLSYPGLLRQKNAWKAGRNNKDYYKGKVVVLFDETTQSTGEFACMAFQSLSNVVSIGSRTAGAAGNITRIYLPGGYLTAITGLGVYYPDGREVQPFGIKPDIEVKQTIEGLRQGKDEVLERALSYIQTGQ